jgi:hypothetical protein
MRAKPDFSRFVSVHYSPTEAAQMVGMLIAFRQRAQGLDPGEQRLVDHTVKRIMLQLKTLRWPLDQAKKAPSPG